MILDCAELSDPGDQRSRSPALPTRPHARIVAPWGRHNLAVGLTNRIDVEIAGNAGYFIGGLGDGPDVVVDGFVGWSVGENLMSGTVRVRGNAVGVRAAHRRAAAP